MGVQKTHVRGWGGIMDKQCLVMFACIVLPHCTMMEGYAIQ